MRQGVRILDGCSGNEGRTFGPEVAEAGVYGLPLNCRRMFQPGQCDDQISEIDGGVKLLRQKSENKNKNDRGRGKVRPLSYSLNIVSLQISFEYLYV